MFKLVLIVGLFLPGWDADFPEKNKYVLANKEISIHETLQECQEEKARGFDAEGSYEKNYPDKTGHIIGLALKCAEL